MSADQERADHHAYCADLGQKLIGDRDRECIVAFAADEYHRVLAVNVVYVGSPGSLPRDIFRWALQFNACSIVIVRNHLSGDPRPSEDDRGDADKMRQCGELLGIEVIDSIIVTKGDAYYSASQASILQLGRGRN